MDDFDAVPFGDVGIGPCCAWADVAIVLDGYSICFQAELTDQLMEAGWFVERIEGAGLAVQNQA
ncbi:hypothetical protein BH10ACI4_BH10ACI4_16460 [soil metagenome]